MLEKIEFESAPSQAMLLTSKTITDRKKQSKNWSCIHATLKSVDAKWSCIHATLLSVNAISSCMYATPLLFLEHCVELNSHQNISVA